MTVERANAENVEPVLGQRSRFVKTANVNLARNIDSVGRNTEDTRSPETIQREARADRERRGKCRGNDHSDKIERTDEDCVPWDLRTWLNAAIRMVNKGTYSKFDKLHSASAETKPRDSRKDHDKSNRVAVKLETNRLWEEHGAHERAFRCCEPYKRVTFLAPRSVLVKLTHQCGRRAPTQAYQRGSLLVRQTFGYERLWYLRKGSIWPCRPERLWSRASEQGLRL